MRILKSSEDYLEAMLVMSERHGYIRSIDIAAELGVTKPSVSYAVKRLRENGYITMNRDGLITLTEKGLEIANRIYERHKVLTQMLVFLGVDPKTARCREDFSAEGEIDILTLLVKCGLAASKGEARRLVQQGGVSVCGQKVADIEAKFSCSACCGEGAVIKKGKKVYHKAVLSE